MSHIPPNSRWIRNGHYAETGWHVAMAVYNCGKRNDSWKCPKHDHTRRSVVVDLNVCGINEGSPRLARASRSRGTPSRIQAIAIGRAALQYSTQNHKWCGRLSSFPGSFVVFDGNPGWLRLTFGSLLR